MSSLVLLVVACWCLVTMATAKDTSTNKRCTSEEMLHKREGYVCGNQIPILVNTTCRALGLGVYNPKGVSCRRNRGVRSATAGADDVFLDRTSALSMLRSTGSKRHYDSIGGAYHTGIVCECCVHKCSLRELQAYCSAKCPSGSAASLSAPAGRPKRIGGGGGGSGDDQHPYPAHQQSQPPASGHQHQWHVQQQQQQHLLAPQSRYTVAGGAGAGADEDGEASEQQARLGNASPPSRLLHPHIQPHRSSSPADDVINELLLTT